MPQVRASEFGPRPRDRGARRDAFYLRRMQGGGEARGRRVQTAARQGRRRAQGTRARGSAAVDARSAAEEGRFRDLAVARAGYASVIIAMGAGSPVQLDPLGW